MLERGILERTPKMRPWLRSPQVALSVGEEMKGLHEGGDMLTQDEDTGRQEGSSEEGAREKGAYSHRAMDGGAQRVCKRLAGEQEVGLPLKKSIETQAGK